MVSPLGFTEGAKGVAEVENIEMATLNSAATVDDHNFIMYRDHLGGVNEHFWSASSTCLVSDVGSSLQSTPVERKEEQAY